MVEPILAFTLFDKALSVLGLMRDSKKQRTEKTNQALLARIIHVTQTGAKH
jgi:hypothetical protein